MPKLNRTMPYKLLVRLSVKGWHWKLPSWWVKKIQQGNFSEVTVDSLKIKKIIFFEEMHKALYIFKLLSEIILSWQTCQNQLRAWWNEMDVLSEEYFCIQKISVEKKFLKNESYEKSSRKKWVAGEKPAKRNPFGGEQNGKTKAWLINQAGLNRSLA